jgi:hypothetical protein
MSHTLHTHTVQHIVTAQNTIYAMSDTLETFISAKFTALALSVPEDDVSLVVLRSFFLQAPQYMTMADRVIFAHRP